MEALSRDSDTERDDVDRSLTVSAAGLVIGGCPAQSGSEAESAGALGVQLLSQAPLAAFSGEPAPGSSSCESGKKMKCVCVFVLKRHGETP